MIEQKDDKRRAAHLSKLFTRGAKSQLLDPLEKLLCYSYNLSLTCCIYWITDLSAACQGTFNMSITTTGLNYSRVSCQCRTSSSVTRQVRPTFDMWGCKQEVAAPYWDIMSDWMSVETGFVFFCFTFCFAQNAVRRAKQPAQLRLGSTLPVPLWPQSKHFLSAATFAVRDPSLSASHQNVWPALNKGHPIKKDPLNSSQRKSRRHWSSDKFSSFIFIRIFLTL